MIINGAKALNGVAENMIGYGNERIWCVVIGIFICCWIFVGLRKQMCIRDRSRNE